MRSLSVLCLLAVAAVCFAQLELSENDMVRRAQIVDYVNELNTTWRAHVSPRFAGSSYEATKRLCGVLPDGPVTSHVREHQIDASAIPESFDARTAWPNCPTIGEVRDQSDCGSCWAFGAVEAASDRVCIATKGALKPHISAEDLVSCCKSCGMGCNGGYPISAWQWFKGTGVVTGGNYGDYSSCRAYSLPNCDHHTTGQYAPCGKSEYSTPACLYKCDPNTTYSIPYSKDKIEFASAFSVAGNPANIQTEIMTNGPVEGAFTVYEDFESYKGGVYQHVSGKQLGGHAIRILGWGVDNGTPYWLVANSWNEDWGEKGFFRIRRGRNECGIEAGVVAGDYKA